MGGKGETHPVQPGQALVKTLQKRHKIENSEKRTL